MTTGEMIAKFERLNVAKLNEIIGTSIVENESDVLGGIKSQLWDGKTGEGQNITPSYLDDPFFKTRQQAEGYRNWKNAITPNSDRNPDTPNLFINGYFYGTLYIDQSFFEVASNSFGNPIIEKYGKKPFILDSGRQKNSDILKDLKVSIIKKINAV
jgi:hypothetical protein